MSYQIIFQEDMWGEPPACYFLSGQGIAKEASLAFIPRRTNANAICEKINQYKQNPSFPLPPPLPFIDMHFHTNHILIGDYSPFASSHKTGGQRRH
jgi:hypothetical protein